MNSDRIRKLLQDFKDPEEEPQNLYHRIQEISMRPTEGLTLRAIGTCSNLSRRYLLSRTERRFPSGMIS